jgi:hypothetical protein
MEGRAAGRRLGPWGHSPASGTSTPIRAWSRSFREAPDRGIGLELPDLALPRPRYAGGVNWLRRQHAERFQGKTLYQGPA